METLVIKTSELEFGVNVQKLDSIRPNPSDGLRRIFDQSDVDQVKAEIIDRYGDIEVHINRSEEWFSVFIFPDMESDQQAYSRGKALWLQNNK